jgi:hypothetical protein
MDAGLLEACWVDPDRLGPVFDVAAVGIVNTSWRNSVMEDWHVLRRCVTRTRSSSTLIPGVRASCCIDGAATSIRRATRRSSPWTVKPMISNGLAPACTRGLPTLSGGYRPDRSWGTRRS